MAQLNGRNSQDLGEDGSDALFRLITEEIKDLNEADKLQGWTPWILSATLISMAWFIVQDVWNERPHVASIHGVFLVVTLGLFVILGVRGAFKDQEAKGPFQLIHTNTTVLSVLVFTLWVATIAIACLTLDGADYMLLAGSLGVVVITMRLPFPAATSSKLASFVLSAIESLTCIFAIVSILKTNVLAVARVSDIRAGGLLALGAYALVLLSQGGRSVEKRTLTELRRDLMLGVLTLDEARHRARIALQGLWLSDVVRDDMRALLKLISEVRALYADAFRKIDTLKASVPLSSPPGEHLPDFEKVAVANTLDVLKTYEERVDEISDKYHARLRSVRFRAKLASRIVKAAASDEVKLVTEIELAQAPADADLRRFVREFHEIQSAWNKWYPVETRQHEPFGLSKSDVSQS